MIILKRSHCSCSSCNIFFWQPSPWGTYFQALVVSLLITQTFSYALPGSVKEAAFSTGKTNRTLTLVAVGSLSTHPLETPLTSDRKQRFCLNRLKDALHVVCSSGSASGSPLYFNPAEYSSISDNDTDSVPFNGGSARNLKNDIPAIAQPQTSDGRPPGRRILRRRSRRNIVRECCEKPCSYNSLRKYCSPTVVRLSVSRDSNMRADSHAVYGAPRQPPALQQCVTVADLQKYYMKFFRIQWKKDIRGDVLEPESEEALIRQDADRFADNFSKPGKKKETHSPVTPPGPLEESRDVNEIDELTKTVNVASQREDQSGNLRTLPPIPYFVNLPPITNDYMY